MSQVYVAACACHMRLHLDYSTKPSDLNPVGSAFAPSTSTMREGITTLPTEVIEEIMSYISYHDISALAETSKRLWLVATPRLQSVVPLLTSRRMRTCIQHLADNPQRAIQILEIHLPKLIPRRNPFPWYFNVIDRFLIATIERVVPLPFFPVETYPELRRVFDGALSNMTSLRVLAVHSRQDRKIWEYCSIVIPSLREIFVYPEAESWFLWHWAMQQRSLTTLRNCWKHADQPSWHPSGPTYRGPVVFPNLQTLITDPEGATEILPKSVVSDLTIQGLSKPLSFSEYPDHVMYSHWADYKPPILYDIVRSNERTPLRCMTLSGTVDSICSVLRELQSRDSLPPRVRVFFELEHEISERDLVRSSPSNIHTHSEVGPCIQLDHPQLDEIVPKLATLEVLEVYKQAIGPGYPDPAIEIPTGTVLMEENKVNAWASACTILQIIRFPSNSKWIVNRENGKLFPRMALQ